MTSKSPQTYADARDRFLQEASKITRENTMADLRHFNVPSAKDKSLFVDDLFVPAKPTAPRNKTLFVLTSGVHGLEASLGSAVQTQFLTDFLEPMTQKAAVWIVHCLNPYGYRYGRRNTEDNINLNRNFNHDSRAFKTTNEGYLKLAPHFEEKSKAAASPAHKFKTLWFLSKRLLNKEFTAQTLSQAVSQGQFTNPQGLEYGGRAPTPQTEKFRERFEQLVKDYEQVILIDLHTGLGKVNRLHLLTGADLKKCVEPALFNQLFHPNEEADLYEFNSGDEKGFYQTVGDINTFVADLAGESSPNKKVVALTFEFGTLGHSILAKADSLSRLWLENQGTHHGFKSPKHEEKIRRDFRALFEPQNPRWQSNALEITREVFRRLVERL